MTRKEIYEAVLQKGSCLCVGLDTDPARIPASLQREHDPVFEFNKRIIDATAKYAIAYKPNLAFYEAQGAKGWESLRRTMEYIPSGIFRIADAKRGDIGNTSEQYAKAFFEELGFDAITLSPYMGKDSIVPYFKHDGKWVIVLGVTSNEGSSDFQKLKAGDGRSVYEHVLEATATWGNEENTMFVAGATQLSQLKEIREMFPGHFLLVPGIGAQGGDLEGVIRTAANEHCGLIINSSRSIIYASSDADFAEAAGREARKVQEEMENLLEEVL